jgi:catechol 2,3-dioxygenase-like lactoylglutathione lyase family enzyme
MQIKDILHIAIRTMDLDATKKFYGEVLGLSVDLKRPATVPAPGVWYDFKDTQIHVIAGPKAYGDTDQNTFGGGNIDHFAVRAVGYDAWRAHLEKYECDYRQNTVASLGQWQLFTRDPNGIVIELQFVIADEPAGSTGPDGTKPYRFGHF